MSDVGENLLTKTFTGPVGPVVFFYWQKPFLGIFYWPRASGSLLASSPVLIVYCLINNSVIVSYTYLQNPDLLKALQILCSWTRPSRLLGRVHSALHPEVWQLCIAKIHIDSCRVYFFHFVKIKFKLYAPKHDHNCRIVHTWHVQAMGKHLLWASLKNSEEK